MVFQPILRAVHIYHTHRTGLFLYTTFTVPYAPFMSHSDNSNSNSYCEYHFSFFHCNCVPETLKRKVGRRRKIYSEYRSFTNTCSLCRWTVTFMSPGSYASKPHLDIFFVIVVAEGLINVLFKHSNSDWCPVQSPLGHKRNMELYNKSL